MSEAYNFRGVEVKNGFKIGLKLRTSKPGSPVKFEVFL